MSESYVLVVEDDPKYLRPMQINLEIGGYKVATALNGVQAINQVASKEPDLVVSDASLPDMDGFRLCEHLREFSEVPIIMVAALADDVSKVRGLDAGADDYLVKPFSMQELLARVRAILRRAKRQTSQANVSIFAHGALEVNFAKRRVFLDGREVALTSTEYKLLSVLVRNAGRVLTPGYLLETLWSEKDARNEQIVWQAVHRLRRKIEPDPQRPVYIHNKPGIGYYFEPNRAVQPQNSSLRLAS